MAPLRKKGRGGGGGKVVAPVPEDLVAAISPTAHLHTTTKLTSATRSRRAATAEKQSPPQPGAGAGAYTSSNLATLVLRSFQREKGDTRSFTRTSLNLGKLRHDKGSEAGSSETTPRLIEFPLNSDKKVNSDKAVEAVHKIGDTRSLSRKKEGHSRDENGAFSRLSCRELVEEKSGRGNGKRQVIGGEKPQEIVRRSASVGRIREIKDKKLLCENQRSKAGVSARSREPKASSSTLSHKQMETKRCAYQLPSKEDDQSSSISMASTCIQSTSPSSRHAALKNACAPSLPLLQERLGWLGVEDSILRKSYTTYQFPDLPSSKSITENKAVPPAPPSDQQPMDPLHVPASDGLIPFCRTIEEKIAHLEKRVTELHAELKQTKEQLHNKDPSSPKNSFVDLQSRVSMLEKLVALKVSEGSLLPSVEASDSRMDTAEAALKVADDKAIPLVSILRDDNYPIKSARLSASESPRSTGIALRSGTVGIKGSTTMSKAEGEILKVGLDDNGGGAELDSNQEHLEERLFPHVALMKNKPALHQKLMESRAALHQRLTDNRTLLRRKLAALEGRDASDDSTYGDVIAAEFLASLKQARDLGLQKHKVEKIQALIAGSMPPPLSAFTSTQHPLEADSTAEAQPIDLPPSTYSLQQTPEIIASSKSAYHELKAPKNGDLREGATSKYDGYLLEQTAQDRSESDQPFYRRNAETRFTQSSSVQNHESEGSLKSNSVENGFSNASVNLECEENISDDASNEQENVAPDIGRFQCISHEEYEDGMFPDSPGRLLQIGEKIASAGWFVSDGEGMLLAHEDGSCSFHDVANMEEKSQYYGPSDMAPAAWRDCWLIRAAGSDGRPNRYVVAASAGGALNSGFCCWDFYDKGITGYHGETQSCRTTPSDWNRSSDSMISNSDNYSPSRQLLSSSSVPLYSETTAGSRSINEKPCFSKDQVHRSADVHSMDLDYPLWWYRPCGPLLASGGSGLKMITFYDIRDGDTIMKWETQKSITNMEFSSPLQWRNKDKLVVAEEEIISLWDVNTTEARCLHKVNSGKQLHALHILNSDAEVSGGVRQRISSSETRGMDGVCCSEEAVNVLDFRVPIGIAMRIPTLGEHVDSVFSQGDAIYAAVTSKLESTHSTTRIQCSVYQWSIRTGKPMVMYTLPESSAHYSQLSLTQVWGSEDSVMAANGNGLYIFDSFKGLTGQIAGEPIKAFQAPKVVGSDDLYSPSFDYSGSRLLLISRNQPACWCYWP